MTEEASPAIARMEAAREELIREYLRLQDEIDAANSQVYDVCCRIRGLEIGIQEVRASEAASLAPPEMKPSGAL